MQSAMKVYRAEEAVPCQSSSAHSCAMQKVQYCVTQAANLTVPHSSCIIDGQ